MEKLALKMFDVILPKITVLIDTLFDLWRHPIQTLNKRLDEDKGLSFSFFVFFMMSLGAYIIMAFALLPINKEIDMYEIGFGFIITQFIMLIMYSLASLYALKSVKIKTTWDKVLKSTAYLYGQVSVMISFTCALLLLMVTKTNSDVSYGIVVTFIIGIGLLGFGWYVMCRVFNASKLQIIFSFILVLLYSTPASYLLQDLSKLFVNF
ncbi:hypothetical protein [Aliivibrio fischeri]|uniref:hypothetical protein n=1 Tax=Aliivibrio fischeri TaxID=668 RepID=UPI001F41E1FB|nr:hypothetical protein [Aliivibrio fischeri]MCE4937489.1 hypothetical protein [Aliivibrio fischeri]